MTKKFNSIERCDCNVIHEDIVNQVVPLLKKKQVLTVKAKESVARQ
jgi:ArsR family transcriptional regulator